MPVTDLVAFLKDRLSDLENDIETEIEARALLYAPPHQLFADVAAKRQIIDEHPEIHRDIGWLDSLGDDLKHDEQPPFRARRLQGTGAVAVRPCERGFGRTSGKRTI